MQSVSTFFSRMEERSRDYRIDGIIFFLIALVIIGHYIEPSRYSNRLSLYLYSLIYSFHMPLFVMISGYFCEKQTVKKIKQFSFRMLEIVFAILFVKYLFLRPPILSLLFFDSNPLWFIICLIYWKVYSFILDEIGLSFVKQTMISFVLAILGFCLINKYEGFLSISRAFQFLPYFSLGRMHRHNPFRIRIVPSVLALVSASILCILFSGRDLHLIEFQRDGLATLSGRINQGYLICLLLKALYWSLSIIVSFSIFEHFRFPTLFEKNGSKTLTIYVLQCYSTPFVARLANSFYCELFLLL